MFKHLGQHPVAAHCLPLLFPESQLLLFLIQKNLRVTFPGGPTIGFDCSDDDTAQVGCLCVCAFACTCMYTTCVLACSIILVFTHFFNLSHLFLLGQQK